MGSTNPYWGIQAGFCPHLSIYPNHVYYCLFSRWCFLDHMTQACIRRHTYMCIAGPACVHGGLFFSRQTPAVCSVCTHPSGEKDKVTVWTQFCNCQSTIWFKPYHLTVDHPLPIGQDDTEIKIKYHSFFFATAQNLHYYKNAAFQVLYFSFTKWPANIITVMISLAQEKWLLRTAGITLSWWLE